MSTWQELADDRSYIFPLALVDALIDLVEKYGALEVKGATMRLFPDTPSSATPAPPVTFVGARSTDPVTSHMAANRRATSDVGRFSMRSRMAEMLQVFWLMEFVGRTATEATLQVFGQRTTFIPGRWEGVRRRCSDLLAAGFIKDTGRIRPNPGTTDMATVYAITPEGKAAHKRLQDTGWSK